MTLADDIIQYQFWFEYGISKLGIYLTIINLGLLAITTLTVKGFFFPIWGVIPIAIGLILFCTFVGHFFVTRNIMGRLTSHMNKKGNPEFLALLETVDRLEQKLDAIEKKLVEKP